MDKKLFRNGPYADFFSQAVQVGNILTLAGQLGDDLQEMFQTICKARWKIVTKILKTF